jgi:hypothetical protein
MARVLMVGSCQMRLRIDEETVEVAAQEINMLE